MSTTETIFERGQELAVFQKPLSEEDLEGVAELLRHIETDEVGHLETWWVHFDGDDGIVRRSFLINEATS